MDADFYNDTARVLGWFNAELSDHVELYADPNRDVYVLFEKYHCDIITTSRVYKSPIDGRENVLPPNAWNSPVVGWTVDRRHETVHFTNGRNMYAFNGFEAFLQYVKIVHATRDTIPFLRYREDLRTEHISKLTDVDSKPSVTRGVRREKIYISGSTK